VKILVTVKRVEDPEIKIKIKPDGSNIETDGMKYVVNPFDEIAVEEALRLRDAHQGEVIVVCVGTEDATQQIRTALAMGADRAVHVVCETAIDPSITATAIHKLVEEEKPDLVVLGKQAIDDDMGQMGIILAEKLGWGQATFASKEASLESEDEKAKKPGIAFKDGRVEVVREVDGAIEHISVALPAIVTTELRLNIPRYASLPGIMKAKKKEIKKRPIAELAVNITPGVKVLKMEAPAQRKAGVTVPDVATLVQKLRGEAKAL
jgi:electron transfer flavoprotein beta subunit